MCPASRRRDAMVRRAVQLGKQVGALRCPWPRGARAVDNEGGLSRRRLGSQPPIDAYPLGRRPRARPEPLVRPEVGQRPWRSQAVLARQLSPMLRPHPQSAPAPHPTADHQKEPTCLVPLQPSSPPSPRASSWLCCESRSASSSCGRSWTRCSACTIRRGPRARGLTAERPHRAT